jgi:hypothetical protein
VEDKSNFKQSGIILNVYLLSNLYIIGFFVLCKILLTVAKSILSVIFSSEAKDNFIPYSSKVLSSLSLTLTQLNYVMKK